MNGAGSKDSNVKSTVEIVAGIIQAVPVYDDALQPAAKQLGKSLETLTKTINIALSPIKALVWGYEQIESWLSQRLGEKLAPVPKENIISPLPNLAGPAIEALRYIGYDDQLRELYANLLAAAMDKETAAQAHPGYVEILKNLSSEEALLLEIFKTTSTIPIIHIKGRNEQEGYTLYQRFHMLSDEIAVKNSAFLPSYIDNLIRLGLLESPAGDRLANDHAYIPLETDPHLAPLLEEIIAKGHRIEFERGIVRLTSFGGQFIAQVVKNKH